MNYVWELILQADKEKIKQEVFRFVNAANPSPYQELSVEILNSRSVGDACDRQCRYGGNKTKGRGNGTTFPVEVNALYRFAEEFAGIFDCNTTGMEQLREIFFDICMHYIARIDLLSGLSRHDFYLRFLEADIIRGRFGRRVKESYQEFPPEEKAIILQSFYGLCRTGSYIEGFKRVVTAIYPKAIIYKSTDHADELLVYLGKKETAVEKRRISLIIDLLLPMQETVHIFYDHHFGIIGMDETMLLDEVVLF